MPAHRQGQAEGLELEEGLHPRGSASDGPSGCSEAREKKFPEPAMTLPALRFIVWRFATFTATPLTPHFLAGWRQTEVGILTSSFRQKNTGTALKEVEAAMASPQFILGKATGWHLLPSEPPRLILRPGEMLQIRYSLASLQASGVPVSSSSPQGTTAPPSM